MPELLEYMYLLLLLISNLSISIAFPIVFALNSFSYELHFGQDVSNRHTRSYIYSINALTSILLQSLTTSNVSTDIEVQLSSVQSTANQRMLSLSIGVVDLLTSVREAIRISSDSRRGFYITLGRLLYLQKLDLSPSYRLRFIDILKTILSVSYIFLLHLTILLVTSTEEVQ